jgi:hypothetical protein
VRIPDELRKTVAHEVENRMNGYQRLMPLDLEVAKYVDVILDKLKAEGKLPRMTHHELAIAEEKATDGVLLDQAEHENGTLLGPLLPLESAWKSLGLSEILREHKFSPRQIGSAKITIYNRLTEPVSENELLSWAKTTALDDLLGERIKLSGEERFYRVSDKLLACGEDLGIHLREREDKAPVMIRHIESEQDLIVLCRSDERKKKEDAIVSRTEEKLIAALEKIRRRIEKKDGKLHLGKGAETVNRNIGKICGRHTRAAKFYTIDFRPDSRMNNLWVHNASGKLH